MTVNGVIHFLTSKFVQTSTERVICLYVFALHLDLVYNGLAHRQDTDRATNNLILVKENLK